MFRWSVPGSLQLGFLLSQGSEFAFVVFSLPAMRLLIGPAWISIAAAAVALSLALTPSLANFGRLLAGRLRRRAGRIRDWEVQMRELQPPVMIIGMGRVGRTLADALHAFDISYSAVERDQRRLSQAVADGYSAVFGNMADPRLWEPVAMYGRRVSVLTAASYETVKDLSPIIRQRYPELLCYVVATTGTEAARFHALGVRAVIGKDAHDLHLAAVVLGRARRRATRGRIVAGTAAQAHDRRGRRRLGCHMTAVTHGSFAANLMTDRVSMRLVSVSPMMARSLAGTHSGTERLDAASLFKPFIHRPDRAGVARPRDAMSAAMRTTTHRPVRRLHPLPIRVMHWLNAFAMIVMITSGWGIYNDDAIIRGFLFPGLAPARRMGGAEPELSFSRGCGWWR